MLIMPAETGRPYRPLSSLPIAFGFFTIIALAVLLLHSPSDQINRLIETYNDAGHSALSLERDDSYSNHTLFRRRDQYSCTKDIPCETEACCGSFFDGVGTCGFGGAFCGSDCTSQCDAKPECGQYADPPGKKCPLNVCCSKYGFCGTQDDYCDASKGCQSNCGTPSIPAGRSSKPVTNRVIGYYEAWAARRECYPFPPAAIPIQGLTHLNLAFAYIDPKSFEIVPMDSLTPSSLFTQTADVRSFKSGLSDLQVYISLGGWTFSDNHTATQPTFGEIASTEANRRKFANNLVHFMRKYGFDGVDLDWEYPGAPDRGGKKEDVKNFVLLMKTLKHTFMHSSRGSYGLTFTIPSSYWYLKWFDMPGLLKYADWTNVMTYDLHGVWDKHNPIGDIVQSHTNLTEIKKSMELLWRNDVPPEKVVFGLGFYGRSFTLNSKSCSKPGCQFAGASKKGACTKSAGTLAYFEIQDIIAEEKPKIIHDKEAAAKYFTFSRDQWVSFDDKETFKQKIDWANKVGLGGVMIWSVDQDDKKFTALKGLLGKSLQDYDALMSRAEKTDTGKWASLNGQKCIMTSCGTPPECPSGYGLAPNGGNFQDNCGKSSYKVVCCPLDSMPSSCLWRGGERSVGRPSCHGQCHTGEVTLFHSRHATKNCLRPGFQAFCCSANTWTKQIDSCHYTECGEKCSGATTKVAQKRGGNCWFGKTQELCCPEDAAFQNCHWVGKGTCDDNECSDTDVQLDLDTYGDDAGSCVGNNRKKVLCCNTPKSLNPFLPVSLDKVFPTLPNEDYYPQFDLQNLGGEAASQKLDYNTFGLIIIVGPEESVQSMRKRDGADAHVLDCESIKPEGRSTIRMVCEEGRNSTCDKIHIGGVEGTVLRMPDGCGPGSYSVLHSVRPASNRDVPHHIARSVSEGYDVLEAEVSFDFGLVKRDAGEIYVRIDYSNSAEYWKSIVQGEPSKSKRSKRSKRSAAPLDKRFYSSGAADWADKFDKLRQASEYQDELYIDRLGLGSIDKHNFNALLGGEVVGNCSSKSDDGFLNMGLSGQLHEALEFGFSFVGTISPKFKMEEAYGYYDTNIQVDGTFAFDGKGSLDISEEVAPAKLFSSPVSAWGFSHPGICNFGPQVDISVELAGHGDIDGDFKAKFIIGNEGVMTDSLPVSTGGHAGGLSSIDASDSFTGSLSLPASKSTPPKNQKRKFSGLGDTVLALNFVTNSQMILELDFYGREQAAAEVQFNQTVHSLFRIARQDDGTPRVEFSNQKGFIESFTRGELPWGDDENQYALKGGETLVLSEKASKPKDRDAPEPDGSGLFDGHDIMSCSGGGRRSGQGKCFCPSGLVKYDRTLHFNPDEGQTSQRRRQRRVAENGHRHGHRRHLHMSSLRAFDSSLDLNPDTGRPWAEDLEVEYLESRAIHYGRAEDYPIRRPNRGGGWTVPFRRYPNGQNGDSLLQLNPNAGRYGAADCYDCGDTGISSNSDDPDMNVVTEHIQERQTEPRAQEFMMNGETQRRDGAPVRSRYPIIDRDYLDPNSFLFRDYSQWDPNGPYTGRPIDEITNAYGSDTNPGVLVNTDSVLNGYKARVWVGSQAMGDDLWDSNGFHQPDSELAGAAIATIRTTIQVISYLNDDEVNRAWSTVINTVVAAYGRYQERVLAVTGVQINPREMYQEYMNEVVIRNIENSIESWVYLRIGQLRRVWEPLRGIDPEAEGILQDLRRLERTMRDEFIDTSRMDIT